MAVKNLAWAVGILAVVIIFIFLYSTKQLGGRDTFIPTPQPVGSPQFDFTEPSTKSAMQDDQQPFTILKAEEIEGKKARIKTVLTCMIHKLNLVHNCRS